LHAGPGALGSIEGASDALVGINKLAGGPLSNDPARRARLTAATRLAILLYAAHNAAATIAAIAGGQIADRLSPRLVFGAGGFAYAAGYLVFAWSEHHWPLLLAGFLLAGVSIGFAETAESTVVAQARPARLHGNGFGVLGLVQSFGDLGATRVAGLLWELVSPTLAFAYTISWMLASVATSAALARGRDPAG
jgi:MFS family permease